MPFTVNVGPYQGGSFLASGISNLGEGISKGLQGWQEQNKMDAYNDTIVQHAFAQGQIGLEDLTKYRQMSHTQKTGFAGGIAANFLEDYKQEQLKSLKAQRQAQAEATTALTEQRQAAAPWANTPIWTTDASGKSIQVGLHDAAGNPHYFPGVVVKGSQDTEEAGPPKVTSLKIPGSDEELGYSVQYPGTKQRDFIPKAPATGLVPDPSGQTDALGTYDRNRVWKPLDAKSNLIIKQTLKQQGAEAVQPQRNILQRAYDAITGRGAPTPTPGPSVAPSPAGAPATAAEGKKLDAATAQQFLDQAGGDPNAARQLAKAAGYTF